MSPKISILAPSFNHEKFVGFFIQSILAQSFSDFECIIVDDCSTDRNVQEILKCKDTRIKLVQHPYNQGINASLNTAFENASGEYLVFLATDDMLEPNALEILHQSLEQNPNAKAIYPQLMKIDKDNQKLEILEVARRSRYELLHHLFMKGNCLTSPGMALRKSDFAEILYPLDRAMCNHQDVQMHIKLLLRGGVVLLDEILVLYRFDERTNNISALNGNTFKRENMEKSKLMDTFLEFKNIAGAEELCKSVFAREIKTLNITPNASILEYFLGRVALLSPIELNRMWGYHQIMESYASKEGAQKLKELYNFEFKDYLKLIESLEILDEAHTKIYRKYKKYKRAFNATLALSLVLCILLIALMIKG